MNRPLGPRQAEVLAELHSRGSLTARQAEHTIQAAELIREYRSAGRLHGTDDPWVEDLGRQIVHHVDRVDAAAADDAYSAEGRRVLASLERIGHAVAAGKNVWHSSGAALPDDAGATLHSQLLEILDMSTDRAA